MASNDIRVGYEWEKSRKRALDRDEHTCRDCGSMVGPRDAPDVRDAEVHHKTPVSDGGGNEIDNLVTLCSRCHTKRYWEQREESKCPECGRLFQSEHGVKVHLGKGYCEEMS